MAVTKVGINVKRPILLGNSGMLLLIRYVVAALPGVARFGVTPLQSEIQSSLMISTELTLNFLSQNVVFSSVSFRITQITQ